MTQNYIEFDAANFLKDEETRQYYLEEAINEGTEEAIMDALSVIARSRGITSLADTAGINVELKQKILDTKAPLQLGTFIKLTQALGYKLSLEPLQARAV